MLLYINHTHPGGTADMRLLETLEIIGSPQNVSEITPIGKETTVFYDKNGKKR